MPFVSSLYGIHDEFNNFIGQIDGALSSERKRITEHDIVKIFEVFAQEKGKEAHSLKLALESTLKNSTSKSNLDDLTEPLAINQILAIFLISIYPYCSDPFFREYVYLIYMITKALNEEGAEIVQDSTPHKENYQHESRVFCEYMDVSIVAEIMNIFIAELFPQYFKTLAEANKIDFQYLGLSEEQIPHLILMCKFLTGWLFTNELTDFQLEINIDF